MSGVFIPPHFKQEPVSLYELKITTLTFGFMIGYGWLTATKGARQSLKIWRRSHRITGYMAMIWIEWVVCMVIGILGWLFINQTIQPSFVYYFVVLVFWCLQIQVILQIIINRLSILIVNQRKAWRIKWFTAGIIVIINISVFCVWIPARLQISPTWIHLNEIWDRIEKGIFLILDAGLNAYFILLVKRNLISKGLSKYSPLFKFNLIMIFVSMMMDVLIIAMMSLPNTYIYVQFQSLAYMVKLHIEMDMAQLITKVARGGNGRQGGDFSGSYPKGTELEDGKFGGSRSKSSKNQTKFGIHSFAAKAAQGPDDMPFSDRGITKTVETVIDVKSEEDDITMVHKEEDASSRSSSTRELRKGLAV